MKNFASFFVYILLLESLFSNSAHAYLDPGTGSIILQGLAAMVIGLSIFWRRIFKAIRSLFIRKDKEDS